MNYITTFIILMITFVIYTGINLISESLFKDYFTVFAIEENSSLTLVSHQYPNHFLAISDEKNNKTLKQEQQFQTDTCPPKPSILNSDAFTSKSNGSDKKHSGFIRINVPVYATTDRPLLIDGTGFIPFEKVRIELVIDWSSKSSEFTNKSFIHCEITSTNSEGNFQTTFTLPDVPLNTFGTGKYSIIGMESKEEKTSIGRFLSFEGPRFSFRQ